MSGLRSLRTVSPALAAAGIALVATPAFGAAVPDVWETYDPAWCSGPCSWAPMTVDDEADVPERSQVTIDVVANDTYQEQPVANRVAPGARAVEPGQELTLIGVGNVWGYDSTSTELVDVGTFDVVDNQVVYTAPALPAGTDGAVVHFVYVVQDEQGDRTPGNATIRIHPRVLTVTAGDDTAQVPFETASVLDVTGNDSSSDGSPVSVSVATAPAHGVVAISGGVLTYTPSAGYIGPDTFTYTASRGTAVPATATVNITVQAPGDPRTGDDTAVVEYASSTDVQVLANDTSFDGSALTVTAVGAATHGTVRLEAGKVTYTAPAGYTGPDEFTYTVTDRTGATATGTARITVSVPEGPQAGDDRAKTNTTAGPGRTAISVLVNDTSPVGATLRLTSVSDGAHGTVAIEGDVAIYTTTTPGYSGPDQFTYVVTDQFDTPATGTVFVDVVSDPTPAPAPASPPAAPAAAPAPEQPVSDPAPAELPRTGVNVAGALAVAAGLVGGGVALARAGTRRRWVAARHVR